MSGHSRWSTIKRKKGAADAKRGKVFTKVIKEITIAARMGGGDPNGNPRLRAALLNARANNLPKDTVDRAIKKGTGELEGEAYEEILYEGFGPGGVALLIEVTTDNRNRTAPEVRSVMTKRGGNLGATGCAAHMFARKGQILIAADGVDEDSLMMAALDAGAEDVVDNDGEFQVLAGVADLEAVREGIEGAGYAVREYGPTWIPQSTIPVEGQTAQTLLRLIETLEDNDDVQNVFANFELSDEEMARLAGE
ncbi:YebC/PmpR family DNA-binding transcriptional regulator [Myxococcota bacterium]|nr:YebC/PmpR family DNA-binding transcriptional regulator [Myxococcota bacterium]